MLLEVEACVVCRTDLHIVDAERPLPSLARIPGYEVVGRVAAGGAEVEDEYAVVVDLGVLASAGWAIPAASARIAATTAKTCATGMFSGYGRDGGYATHMLPDAASRSTWTRSRLPNRLRR